MLRTILSMAALLLAGIVILAGVAFCAVPGAPLCFYDRAGM